MTSTRDINLPDLEMSLREALVRAQTPVGDFTTAELAVAEQKADRTAAMLLSPKVEGNATFHAFKPSGKWYTSGRGVLSQAVYDVFNVQQRRSQIVRDNFGRYPGMSGPGADMTYVVVGDEDAPGYPLMLRPEP